MLHEGTDRTARHARRAVIARWPVCRASCDSRRRERRCRIRKGKSVEEKTEDRLPFDLYRVMRSRTGIPSQLSLFCTVLGIAADLFQPYLVKIAIDDNLMIGRNDYKSLLLICLFYAGLSVSSLFFSYLQNNLLQFAGQSIVARIRKDLFQHIFQSVDVVLRPDAKRKLDYACFQRYGDVESVFYAGAAQSRARRHDPCFHHCSYVSFGSAAYAVQLCS